MKVEKDYRQSLSLPPGCNWQPAILYNFGNDPNMDLLPCLFRMMSVACAVQEYGRLDVVDTHLNILDVGGGFGEIYHLVRTQRKASGVTLNWVMIDVDHRKRAKCLERFPEVDYRLAALGRPEFHEACPEEGFDMVVFTEVIHHLSKSEGVQCLTDIVSKAATGGIILLTTMSGSRTVSDGKYYQHIWKPETLRQEIENLPVSVVDHYFLRVPLKDLQEEFPAEIKGRIPISLYRATHPSDKEGSTQVWILRRES